MPALKTMLDGPYLVKVPWLEIHTCCLGREPIIDFLAGSGLCFHQLIAKFDGGDHLHPRWEPSSKGLRPTKDDSFSPSGFTLQDTLSQALAQIARFHQWSRDLLLSKATAPQGRFAVPDWEGTTLLIPVDAIRVYSIGRRKPLGPAHCALQLLPHLELGKLTIFDRDEKAFKAAGGFGLGKEAECLHDQGLRTYLEEILRLWDIRGYVLRVLQSRGDGREFVFPLWDYDPDHPSILRFE